MPFLDTQVVPEGADPTPDKDLTIAALRARVKELEAALRNLLAAKDAATDYYARIPDGCAADTNFAGRLIRKETLAEDAARAALTC